MDEEIVIMKNKDMQVRLPAEVKQIIDTLYENGFEAYAVGGCVRDSLLGRTPQDWDITTSARPGQVKALFRRTIDTGIQHGTVTVMMGKNGYEVTTYRIDGIYEDARHPKEVTFTGNLIEDLKRRDFTINAMAWNDRSGLVDAFDGVGDLGRKVIRCVGDPNERFSEDALRMLRALRFAAQLGFEIDPATREAVRGLAGNLKKVSTERITAELTKLLLSPHPSLMRDAWELGLTETFLPEWDLMMVTEQNTPHHFCTVGEHTICALEEIRPDRVLRFTMLLHDVAKPLCRTTDENGRDHFKTHPEKGAVMAEEILRRLKLDNALIRRCSCLIRWHDDRPALTEKSVRRAVSRAGDECFPDLFEIKYADTMAQSAYKREEKLADLREFERLWKEILAAKQPLDKKDLAVTGRDLIEAGLAPGRQMGAVIEELFQMVLDDPKKNSRELLLSHVRKTYLDKKTDICINNKCTPED